MIWRAFQDILNAKTKSNHVGKERKNYSVVFAQRNCHTINKKLVKINTVGVKGDMVETKSKASQFIPLYIILTLEPHI